jgi:hypothetical protein
MGDKKLNIIEAMKMPVGTLFEVYGKHGNKDSRIAKIIEEPTHETEKMLVWDNRAFIKIDITNYIADATFVPIPKSVSFMEIVNSDKRCKVEHEKYITRYDLEYCALDGLLYFLCSEYDDKSIKEIIKEGKWYTEK